MRSSRGFARTGRMFAIEHAGIEPDLITVAKSIAGGVPLSAVIGKAEIMDAPPPGGLGGTYAGSPLGCAAASRCSTSSREEQLLRARAATRRRCMRSRLRGLQQRFPAIGEVRGLGAMVAMELVKNARRRSARCGADAGAGAGGGAPRPGDPLLRRVRQRDPLPRAAHDQRRAARRRAATCSRLRSTKSPAAARGLGDG